MANDYLMLKWRAAFKASDIDRNGTVDMDDARLFLDRFFEYHNLKGERAKEIRQQYLPLWKELFLMEGDSISEDEYLRKTAADYNNNEKEFRKRIERFMTVMCGFYDVNGDGYLSEDEYLVTIKCHGNKELDRKYLQAYPQVPGKSGHVLLREFVESWVEYMANGDKENIGKEKPCLIGYKIIQSD